jgi:hypothetical protein
LQEVPPYETSDAAKGDSKSHSKASGGDQGLITKICPTEVAREIVKEVKTTIDHAVSWVEKKADALSVEDEHGIGPYASPATCVPSSLDPIASGIIPAVEAETSKGQKSYGSNKDGDPQEKVAEKKRK